MIIKREQEQNYFTFPISHATFYSGLSKGKIGLCSCAGNPLEGNVILHWKEDEATETRYKFDKVELSLLFKTELV